MVRRLLLACIAGSAVRIGGNRATVGERQDIQVPCVTTRLHPRWPRQRDCTQPVVDVPEMRAPMAESTRNFTWQAEMVLSGAVLGSLRDFEAMKTGKQLVKLGFSGFDACGERVYTRRQLDRTTDLKAGFEGVRHETRTRVCV